MLYVCRLNSRLFSVALLLMLTTGLMAQERSVGVAEALVKSGFTNVRAVENDSLFVVTVENDAYKLQASGLAAAIRVLEEQGVMDGKSVKIVATYYNVPQVTLTYNPAVGRWKTSYRLDDGWKLVKREAKSNSSIGNVDIVVYPQLSLMNLIIDQVYQSLWQLSPSVEFSPWPGAKVSAQVKIPLFNDGYGELEDKVHPGLITLSQRFRIPGNIFGRVSAGLFSNNRHGVALDLYHPFSFNERFSIEGSFSMLGLSYWRGFEFHYNVSSPVLKPYWSAKVNYYSPLLGSQFSAKVQKFLLDDYGVKGEMVRHFRYCSIGFYLEKGLNSYARLNGGFSFAITLPPYRYRRHGHAPRVTTSFIGMTYNANNEQRWFKENKYEAGDNIMEKNGFNPYYIDKEISRYNINY